MTMEFMFAVVPFEQDGYLHELHHEVPNLGDFTEYLKEGVRVLQITKEDDNQLALNIRGIDNTNLETGGAFLELTGGSENQRYILLAQKRNALERLRAAIPQMGTEYRRKFLEVFVRNADAALEQGGEGAALIIF